MSDINVCTFSGRLGGDAELRKVGEQSVLKIRVAVGRTFKTAGGEKRDETTWLSAQLWGKRADALAQYLVKGKQVVVTGELRQEEYEKDGQKRTAYVLNVNDLTLVGGEPRSAGGDAAPYGRSGAGNSSKYSGSPDDDREIPF